MEDGYGLKLQGIERRGFKARQGGEVDAWLGRVCVIETVESVAEISDTGGRERPLNRVDSLVWSVVVER